MLLKHKVWVYEHEDAYEGVSGGCPLCVWSAAVYLSPLAWFPLTGPFKWEFMIPDTVLTMHTDPGLPTDCDVTEDELSHYTRPETLYCRDRVLTF